MLTGSAQIKCGSNNVSVLILKTHKIDTLKNNCHLEVQQLRGIGELIALQPPVEFIEIDNIRHLGSFRDIRFFLTDRQGMAVFYFLRIVSLIQLRL